MFSDIFLNPKKYDKVERREKLKNLSNNKVIFKNNFSGFNYSILDKKEIFKEENINYFKKYITDIKIPVYELLSYDVLTKFYLDCEMENIPQNIYNNKENIFLTFNEYLLKFLNKKFPDKKTKILYADSSRPKNDNYKISIHAIINELGYFKRSYLKKLVLEFIEYLPNNDFYKNGKSFVDSEVYHNSQLIRIIYSPNNSANSVLKPFTIENNKILYKDIEYISNNFEKSLCGNYNNIVKQSDILEELEEPIKYKPDIIENIPKWKIKWIENSNYVKNIYKVNNINGNLIDLIRINFNSYCKLCKRNHERENAFCKIYKNNIMFYCNRNNKGISIGSWYDSQYLFNNNILDDLKKENKLLKEKVKELEKENKLLKENKNLDYNTEINSKWSKYYDCGKLLVDNKNTEFNNIIGQIWKESNISKLKNRCMRIYKIIEYMKENKIKTIKSTIRSIFHLPNWKFDEQLKNNNFF